MTWLSPAAFWGLVAAIPAVLAEYLYRVLPGPWWQYLWIWIPFSLSISYAINRLVKVPQTALLDAFVIWAFSTMALRVVVTLALLRDPVRQGTWIALGLIVLARCIQAWWGR